MDSSSSNSSGQQQQNSGCGAGLVDQRKRKRMISNRESARRSRLKKQKHLDGLMARVAELRMENQQIINGLAATSQNFLTVESENAILRAQLAELSHRLRSLDEIASFVVAGDGGYVALAEPVAETEAAYGMAEFGNGYWNCSSQPIMMSASADHGFLY